MLSNYKLLLLFSITVILNSCKTTELRIVRDSLDKKVYKKIKNDREITKSLYLALKDSVSLKSINEVLTAFFQSNDKKQLINGLELRRVFNSRDITFRSISKDSIDMSKALIIDSFEELKQLKVNLNNEKKILFNSKVKIAIDSTMLKKDSIN